MTTESRVAYSITTDDRVVRPSKPLYNGMSFTQ